MKVDFVVGESARIARIREYSNVGATKICFHFVYFVPEETAQFSRNRKLSMKFF